MEALCIADRRDTAVPSRIGERLDGLDVALAIKTRQRPKTQPPVVFAHDELTNHQVGSEALKRPVAEESRIEGRLDRCPKVSERETHSDHGTAARGGDI
jgi:hypothetical protein